MPGGAYERGGKVRRLGVPTHRVYVGRSPEMIRATVAVHVSHAASVM